MQAKKSLIWFLMGSLLSVPSFAHGNVEKAKCDKVFGLKQMQDFKQDGSEYTRFVKTPLYKSYSNEQFFNFFAMTDSDQRSLEPEVKIEILNNKKKVLKRKTFSKWKDHPQLRGKSILNLNFIDFIKTHLIGPFDVYINLDKTKRDEISVAKVPYSAVITIKKKSRKDICKYHYDYGSLYMD